MSKNTHWTEYCKNLISKSNLFEDKENKCSSQNVKWIEDKSDGERKKGLSVDAENQKSDVDRKTSIPKLAIGSKTQFEVYRDDNDGSERSRSLVRGGAYKREIKRIKDRVQWSTHKKVLRGEGPTCSTLVVPQRTRSLSNQNKAFSSGDNNLAAGPRRTCSENRKSSNVRITASTQVLSISPKIKYLSNEVKKRTSCSIQMWKNKMRKFRVDNMPKNSSTIYFAATKADGACAKIEPSNSGISSEFVMMSQAVTSLNTQADIGVRSCTRDNDRQFREKLNSKCTTLLDNPSIRSLTSKVEERYEENEVTSQFSTKKEGFARINQTLYERDYLMELPNMEREREEKAPKLSSSFLRKKINAPQRRLIVAFLIHLGVRCNYESPIIYQTIKLFDIAVDRILVDTEQIQLMALACLWIILKRELANFKIPTATKMLKLAEDMYKDQEKCLLMCEIEILSAVKFNIRFADPYSLIMYYISNLNQATRYMSQFDMNRVYFCSSYLIDLSMLDESLCVMSVFVLTITAFELALDFILASNPNIDQTWRRSLKNKDVLAIWEEGQISFVKQIMIKLILKSDKSDARIVYRKYRRSRCCGISSFLLDSAKKAAEET